MAEAFARHFALKLVVPNRKNSAALAQEDPFNYYHVDRVFEMIKISCCDLRLVKKISEKIWFKILNDSFLRAAARYLHQQAQKDDIYYTRDEKLLDVFDRIKKNTPIRFFYECHAVPDKMTFLKLKTLQLDGVITLNSVARAIFLKNGFSPERVIVAHDAVDLNFFSEPIKSKKLRHELYLPPEKKIATYVGRFQTMGMEKGIGEILKAARLLLDEKNLHFLFIGGPLSLATEYKKQIQSWGLDLTRFEFRDRVPPTEVAKYLRVSDVLLMPFPKNPHYEINMSPLKMFEYMASGVPIVASDLAPIRDILTHEETALLCAAGDEKSLATCLKRALHDEKTCSKIAQNAKEAAKAHTWDQRAKRILDFIHNQ
jgi:glycosyltransferase involved in cell wall biosynthesis